MGIDQTRASTLREYTSEEVARNLEVLHKWAVVESDLLEKFARKKDFPPEEAKKLSEQQLEALADQRLRSVVRESNTNLFLLKHMPWLVTTGGGFPRGPLWKPDLTQIESLSFQVFDGLEELRTELSSFYLCNEFGIIVEMESGTCFYLAGRDGKNFLRADEDGLTISEFLDRSLRDNGGNQEEVLKKFSHIVIATREKDTVSNKWLELQPGRSHQMYRVKLWVLPLEELCERRWGEDIDLRTVRGPSM